MEKSNEKMWLSPYMTVEDSLVGTNKSCKQELKLPCSSNNCLREGSTDKFAPIPRRPDICLTTLATTSVIRHKLTDKCRDVGDLCEVQKLPFSIPLSPLSNNSGAEETINLSPRVSPLHSTSLFSKRDLLDEDPFMLSRAPAFDQDESDDQDMFHIVRYRDTQMRDESLSPIIRSTSFDEYDTYMV